MELLEQRILREGKVRPGGILKVDSFLNHQIDPQLLYEMACELKRLYEGEGVNKIFTIEASGIAIASLAGYVFGCPVVFAKKSNTAVLGSETVQAGVYSFTHKTQNTIRIERRYLPEGSRVLIIDDFLADGQAVKGMMNLCEQQKATVIGVGIAVEKGFQPGGQQLREAGVRVKSLAIVERIENGKIILRSDDD